MRLDHLLSKEGRSKGLLSIVELSREITEDFGGDAPGGDTRTHPEHEG